MSNPSTTKTPAIAFVNGRVLTMDPEKSRAEAVVVRGGRLEAVGEKSILETYPGATIVDLENRIVLPAFIDAHNHLSFGCFLPKWANLRGLTQKEPLLEAVKAHAASRPAESWIVGYYWVDQETGGPALDRHDLDKLGLGRPILLIHHSFHKSLASTLALERAEIGKQSSDPVSGKIVRDAGGEPTGVLWEAAQIPVFKLALKTGEAEYASLIEARAKELLAFGITAVHDPGVTPEAEAVYSRLHSEGRLPVSVLMMPHGEALVDNRVRLDGPVTGAGDEHLRIGPVKLFADGGVSGTMSIGGTIMGTPYAFGAPRDDFREQIAEAARRGFRVCVHSIGNLSTEDALAAFEAAARSTSADLRPRLEHVFLLSDEQIKRLAALGGCAVVQPCFLSVAGPLTQAAFDGLKWFAFRDLLEGGVALAGSSDDPGGYIDGRNPILGSVMGATMSDGRGNTLFPDQTLPFETWLRAFTAGAAYAGGQEGERGVLRRGLVADLVVLDGEFDLGKPPVVAETWKDGEKVYVRPVLKAAPPQI